MTLLVLRLVVILGKRIRHDFERKSFAKLASVDSNSHNVTG